ncbi:MAG: HD superfamily membrane-associated hydrolase [Chlorobi bacterium OLB4]|jgi:putative nucleotidyltransferase with HDIG domain|nr:MAG: HD superfamily membrane-associated hydrolase [Chlorobi bacterium OLB4]MBW7855832.1 HDIG domain-containing protein [Ignavibacteria bacterium]OQY76568.1 MAG: hypothetical protein B6D43_10340 [Ignavibacteriales bacterium UTCHB1]
MSNLLSDISKRLKLKSNPNLKGSSIFKAGVGILTVFIIILLLPGHHNIDVKFEVGTIWVDEDLIAPFSFPIYRDESEYLADREKVKQELAPVFDKVAETTSLSDQLQAKLNEVFLQAEKSGGINSESLKRKREETGLILSHDEWLRLYGLFTGDEPDSVIKSFNQFFQLIDRNIETIQSKKIIDIPKKDIVSGKISIVQKKNENVQDITPASEVMDLNEASAMLRNEISSVTNDNELILSAEEIGRRLIQPNLKFNTDLTQVVLENRLRQVQKTSGIVRQNERIISKHDPITPEVKLKLDSYKKIRLERLGVQDFVLQFVGKSLTVLTLLSILALFLYYIRRDIFNDNNMLILISSLLILESFFAYLSLNITVNRPVELLIFASVASILLTIIFDSRLAFFSAVIICFLIAAVRGGDYTIAFISFCGSVLAIFSVRNARNRNQIFRSFFFILIGNTVAILAIGFDRMEEFGEIFNRFIYGGINAVMSPVIAFGLLIFYERVFKITTDITLLELSDRNHPLLKELFMKAPGTYNHSMMMGNLAEKAAESIGANSILARVGCYFHDIGKMMKPEYFIENQFDRFNRHELLKPSVSAKIIIAHVKEGVELAKKYKLPQSIINFIPQHHGTTLVSFFYDKALNQTDLFKESVEDETYRYPGPKPQTKEAGIIMLADTVEAVTRTLDDSSPNKIEKTIDEVIKARFMDGQLDECELTLKDLTKIKQSFLQVLMGSYHSRIKYPDQKKADEREMKEQTQPAK